ncbi:hypothetical protein MN202_20175 [Rheinheimera muenzenbergensis]|uniref:Uncharacterized protein n=1 Tax=Rheinheimera muenzenbergensis TaxID=1193628 RepID=A0ABU8CCL3_9GAMM
MNENDNDEYEPYNEILMDEGLGIYLVELNPDDNPFNKIHLELHQFPDYHITKSLSDDVLILRFPQNYVEKIVASWLKYQQQKLLQAACKGEQE